MKSRAGQGGGAEVWQGQEVMAPEDKGVCTELEGSDGLEGDFGDKIQGGRF